MDYKFSEIGSRVACGAGACILAANMTVAAVHNGADIVYPEPLIVAKGIRLVRGLDHTGGGYVPRYGVETIEASSTSVSAVLTLIHRTVE